MKGKRDKKGREERERKHVIFRNEWKNWGEKIMVRERKNTERKEEKKGKEAGERGEVVNFVLESKSCIGWDKPQAKFTIKQKQKFTMKRK